MKGQGVTEYLLLLAAVLVILAIAAYYVFTTEAPTEEQTTIEGMIIDVTYGESWTTIIWENQESRSALRFVDCPNVIPVNEHVKLKFVYNLNTPDAPTIISVTVIPR